MKKFIFYRKAFASALPGKKRGRDDLIKYFTQTFSFSLRRKAIVLALAIERRERDDSTHRRTTRCRSSPGRRRERRVNVDRREYPFKVSWFMNDLFIFIIFVD